MIWGSRMPRPPTGAGIVRVDLHVHSAASFDCKVKPRLVAQRCESLGLGAIFLTDHDTIAGATSLPQRIAPRVLTGEEITTREGELIGLFLQTEVESGGSALDTAREIKEQGGLVYLPHPLDRSRPSLHPEAIDRIIDHIDIIEVFNGRATPEVNSMAEELCQHLGAVAGAGSDAHTAAELGSVYVQMHDFDGPTDFVRKLERSGIVRRPSRLRARMEARFRTLASLRVDREPRERD